MAESASRRPSKFGREFVIRTLSAMVMAPIALLAIYYGGWWLFFLIFLVALLSAFEWVSLVAPKDNLTKAIALAGISLTALILHLAGSAEAFAVLLLAGFAAYYFLQREGAQYAGVGALGIPYVGLSLLAFNWLIPQRELTLFVLLAIWATDIGAYFLGRLIGGAKLAPRISPGKTWAGFWGGMACAALVAGGWALYVQAPLPWVGALIGACLAASAQTGDLMESALKRACGAKDSGKIIPGHGGILDRVDGFLLAVPVFVVFQLLIGVHLGWW